MATRKTIGQIGIEYMRNKGYSFVMLGDSYLLHEIADAAGLSHRGFKTEIQIMNALDRSGLFVKKLITSNGVRRVLYVPECTPAR